MHYGLTVNVSQWPPDLGRLWRETLRPHGLVIEPAAECRPAVHSGGPLTFHLAVTPESFAAAGRYGNSPLLAGFEASFQRLSRVDHTLLSIECPAPVRLVYRRCPYEAHFSTDRGRTVADFRLQCFAAAALTVACGGVMHDSRSSEFFVGDAAWRHAAREADRYEANACDPGDWFLASCDSDRRVAAAVRYDRSMIKNPQAYARQSEKERWDALRGMSAAESIAIGEALLTSDLMRLAEFPDDDHPLSLAIALGLRPTAAARPVVPDDASE
jgi:hypothetical protein